MNSKPADENVQLLGVKLRENGYLDTVKNKLGIQVSDTSPFFKSGGGGTSTTNRSKYSDEELERELKIYVDKYLKQSYKVISDIRIPSRLYDPYLIKRTSTKIRFPKMKDPLALETISVSIFKGDLSLPTHK